MNLSTKHKQSHRCRKQTYGYQPGKWGRGGINWEIGIDIYILPYKYRNVYIYMHRDN